MAVINMLPTGTGTGSRVEKRLWRNPSPTSQYGSQVAVSIPKTEFNSYNYFKFVYYKSVINQEELVAYFSLEELNDIYNKGCLHGTPELNQYYARFVNVITNEDTQMTSFSIRACYLITSGATANDRLIPYEIYGITGELVPITKYEDVLWENADTTTAFANQTVTLTDSLANYDAVRLYFNWSTSQGDRHTQYVDYDLTYINEYIKGNYYRMMIGMVYNNSTYTRNAFIGDGYNKVIFGTSARINASGTNNSTNIPVKISGIKYA